MGIELFISWLLTLAITAAIVAAYYNGLLVKNTSKFKRERTSHYKRCWVVELTSKESSIIRYVNRELENTDELVKSHDCLMSKEELDRWINNNLSVIIRSNVRLIDIFYNEIYEIEFKDDKLNLVRV